jgi:hypothetical protein
MASADGEELPFGFPFLPYEIQTSLMESVPKRVSYVWQMLNLTAQARLSSFGATQDWHVSQL